MLNVDFSPSIAVSHVGLKKTKTGLKRKARKWVMKEFVHTAREDKCTFHHWARATDDGPYPFAAEKFHRRLRVFNFTESDFYRFLNDDSSWTYKEVRHIFVLTSLGTDTGPAMTDKAAFRPLSGV